MGGEKAVQNETDPASSNIQPSGTKRKNYLVTCIVLVLSALVIYEAAFLGIYIHFAQERDNILNVTVLPAKVVTKADETETSNVYKHTVFEDASSRFITQSIVTQTIQMIADTDEPLETYELPVQEEQPASSEAALTLAAADATPISYTALVFPGIDFPVYVFRDHNGDTQYRGYATSDSGAVGFFQIKPVVIGSVIGFVIADRQCIDPEKEDYGTIVLSDAPQDALHGINNVYGTTGLYYVQSGQQRLYVVYGHYPNDKDGFYLADKNGRMLPGTFEINIDLLGKHLQ